MAVLKIQIVNQKQFSEKSSIFGAPLVYRQVPYNGECMHQSLKIDRMYCCKLCFAVFLFESDVEEHATAMGHREIREAYFD